MAPVSSHRYSLRGKRSTPTLFITITITFTTTICITITITISILVLVRNVSLNLDVQSLGIGVKGYLVGVIIKMIPKHRLPKVIFGLIGRTLCSVSCMTLPFVKIT